MNYVAHAFLAPPAPIAVLGNLLGDYAKGPLPGDLDAELAAAVAQHRAIDTFTDSHPAFAASRRRLFDVFSHYAGVIADVFYDHLLTARWDDYATESLDEFAERVYGAIGTHGDRLPEGLREIALRMRRHDAMRGYRSTDGIRRALVRISGRARRDVDLAPAVDILIAERTAFERDFERFLPDVLAFRNAAV